MKAGTKILWSPSGDPLAEPIAAEIVSESENSYSIRHWVRDHWSYAWAAKDRVIEAPE